ALLGWLWPVSDHADRVGALYQILGAPAAAAESCGAVDLAAAWLQIWQKVDDRSQEAEAARRLVETQCRATDFDAAMATAKSVPDAARRVGLQADIATAQLYRRENPEAALASAASSLNDVTDRLGRGLAL